jgi:hypothetical protein
MTKKPFEMTTIHADEYTFNLSNNRRETEGKEEEKDEDEVEEEEDEGEDEW